jgi:glycosyltransferase involved in cell wall biosynthesis
VNSTALSTLSLAVVIPALNEEASIERVVRAVIPYAAPIVVDDGSSDHTAKIALNAGAIVIIHGRNMGYDAALESGLFRSIELGYDYAITMDGDGQHTPETLELFKQKFAEGADLVIGVRDKHQRFAETIFALVGRYLWGVKDPLCGMKGYRLKLLSKVGHFDSYKSIGTEFTLRAAQAGYRIEQFPIITCTRGGSSRFGAGMIANWKILRSLACGLLRAGQ